MSERGVSVVVLENGDIIRRQVEYVDVRSLNRPDPRWHHIDPSGHEHRWYVTGSTDDHAAPADHYDPRRRYLLPTLVRVTDAEIAYITDEGEAVHAWHWECRQCGSRVEPRTMADTSAQLIPVLQHYEFELDAPESLASDLVNAGCRQVLIKSGFGAAKCRATVPLSVAKSFLAGHPDRVRRSSGGEDTDAIVEFGARLLHMVRSVEPNWTLSDTPS